MPQLKFIACPLCENGSDFRDIEIKYPDGHLAGYRELYRDVSKSSWKICGRCGFVHQNPRPSKEALNAYYTEAQYRGEMTPPDPDNYRKFSRWYYEDKFRYVSKISGIDVGSVYDIGCGYGGALSVFSEHGWTVSGVESDGNCSRFATEALGLRNVSHGVLDDTVSLNKRVDVVFSNHSFEHFSDLDDVMRGIVRIIKPRGFVMTVVPTYRENRSTLSKRWMNSSHYSIFTHASLDQLFSKYGFEPVHHTYRGWMKEIDELWHVARFTGGPSRQQEYFEKAADVDRYLRVTNPVRSVLYSPVFDRYSERRQLLQHVSAACRIFLQSPSLGMSRIKKRLLSLLRG
jgi:SAM-dependent methyltransferase